MGTLHGHSQRLRKRSRLPLPSSPYDSTMLSFQALAASVPTVEECAQRWFDGVIAEATRVLRSSASHKERARAAATLSGRIRTLTRRCGRQMNLSVPGWVRDATGWEPGTQVVLGLTERGELMVRKATSRDLEPFLTLQELNSNTSASEGAPPPSLDSRHQSARANAGPKRHLASERPDRATRQTRPMLTRGRKGRHKRPTPVSG